MAERRPAPRRSGRRTRRSTGSPDRRADDRPGVASRRVAIEAMLRIETGGAFANLVLPELLNRSDLEPADRRFVTELVYGATRMRRACDHLVDRFLLDTVEPRIRAALRLGAYQLAFLATPAHAAIDATVSAAGGRGRSVVNAVLRRVATAPVEYPDLATEWSYPDWIVDRLTTDLGSERAEAALLAMNEGATATVRADGYTQDRASQLVVDAVEARPGDRVLDLCAAPGGKATALAEVVGPDGLVVAADLRPKRARLVTANAVELGARVPVVVADGRHSPFARGSADRVLVDAPCSGLGSLRRRADARWRIDADAPERLAVLQTELVVGALDLVRPGGTVTYSVCTLTAAESTGVLAAVLATTAHEVEVLAGPGPPWSGSEGVATLLPTVPGADGETAVMDAMHLFRLRRWNSLAQRGRE